VHGEGARFRRRIEFLSSRGVVAMDVVNAIRLGDKTFSVSITER
jgi:hypothetical protein